MSKREGYTLSDLATITGLSQRTVRYYLQEVVGTGTGSKGRKAVYPRTTLDRLRVVELLKERAPTLRLSEVKEILASLGDEMTARVAGREEPLDIVDVRSDSTGNRSVFMGSVVTPGKRSSEVHAVQMSRPPAPEPRTARDYIDAVKDSFREHSRKGRSWTTIRLADDVELRVRKRLSEGQREQLALLGKLIGSIVDEEP